jgi:hypothetical protein
MNPEFWNSRGFSERIPVGIVPSPVVLDIPNRIFSFTMKSKGEVTVFFEREIL